VIRGRDDEWYSQQKFEADTAALRSRGVQHEALLVDGGHEWHQPVLEAAGRLIEEISASRGSPRV
jgi:predicted esterase